MKQATLALKLSLIGLILGPVFIWGSYAHLLNKGLSTVAYPFLILQGYITAPFMAVGRYIKTHDELCQQIQTLSTQYRAMQAEYIQLNAERQYAEDIAEVVEFNKRYLQNQGTLAHVLLKQFSADEQSYLINFGAAKGAQESMVVVYKNCLIGRIETVYPYFSKVILITDQRCKVACYCRGSKAKGIHEGTNTADQGRIQYINHLQEVLPGQLVISSGQGVVFPQGFGLARITYAQKDELTWQVQTTPLVDLTTIDYCLVLPKEV